MLSGASRGDDREIGQRAGEWIDIEPTPPGHAGDEKNVVLGRRLVLNLQTMEQIS